MSEFIDRSKHPQGSAAVDHHFFKSDNKESVGEASGKQFQRGMTSAWDTVPIGSEHGLMNTAPNGASSGPSIFNDNIASRPLQKETGVNYKPLSHAGHSLPDAPFAGPRDGYPGNTPGTGVKKLIWD